MRPTKLSVTGSTLSRVHTKAKTVSAPKVKREKLEDITDDLDEIDDTLEEHADEIIEDMPELEAVSQALKEKYEYKPMQEIKTVYVRPEDRITSEIMTRFEFCEVVSIRAKQIEDGDQAFTDIGDISDPIEIAKKEVVDKKCPLSIVRVRTTEGDTSIAELWHVNEMGISYD